MVFRNLIWTSMMRRRMVLSCSAQDWGTFITQVIAWTRTSRMKMIMILKTSRTWLSNQRMQSLFVHATRMNLVWILDETSDGDSNVYVHHEVPLSAFPLCTAWLDCPLKGGEKGNFIAVGSMEPAIEIWDLDIIDEVQPAVVLGGIKEKKKKKKGKKASIKYKEGSHTDSVLGLAWNKHFRNILASASADRQVKIWDVDAGKCSSSSMESS
uniref:Uncharacterized protein n=1 Tax=Salix viminalis TaxID=40686 RepID=A0A6N2LCW2_SALVM